MYISGLDSEKNVKVTIISPSMWRYLTCEMMPLWNFQNEEKFP
jgi:hypothetical protein